MKIRQKHVSVLMIACAVVLAAAAFDTFKPKTGKPYAFDVQGSGSLKTFRVEAKNVLSVNKEMICFKNKGRVTTFYTSKITPLI